MGMEFGIKKCAMLIMKKEKRETMEGVELPNKESIRILSEKENYKYFGILEADVIRDERKSKKRNTSEQENFSKPSSVAQILSKK